MMICSVVLAFALAASLIGAVDRFPNDDTPLARIQQFDHTYRILTGLRAQPVYYKPLPTKREVQAAEEEERAKKERARAIKKIKASLLNKRGQ